MNGWVAAVTHQDSAIRQFCAARMEEQEQGREWEHDDLGLHEIWSSLDFTNDTPPLDVDQFVDTFFNAEYYDNDHLQQQQLSNIDDDGRVYVEANTATMMNVAANVNGVDEGLQLVHLLLACAEAVGCRDAQLAHSILNQIWPCVNPWGDSLQRVSHCFAMGLKSRLSLLQNVNPNGSFSSNNIDASTITREERNEAFALLHKTTPYIAFGFVAANDAICQAAKGEESLHIIDLGMEHNLQWPSMVKTLSTRPEGPPKHVRITGVIGDLDAAELEGSMRILCKEAAAVGISLEYSFVREQVSASTLTREKLGMEEAAVFVNSVMQLHRHVRESRGSLKKILQSIKKLGPKVVTVVEQDANHNGPFFLGRFLESLHYYSAVFDSLDSSLPRGSGERMKIERWHLAEEICNVVACEGDDRVERHERADQWRRQLGRAGFQVMRLKCLDEAKAVVSGYGCDGYTVACEKGCLQLGWKGRPIMLASAWHLNNLPSSSSSSNLI
ncbi:GRAS family protein RAD1-like [Salvia miltiorrhiza]|uniref:GRAS family protein RAD1-like n=1 Tax=Salvia miltiorrhiza TaxID=226208 RepID=UPI0025AD5222|nr:GRAS family protein RAD1-like [Salvia miltiorrhiza]